MFKLQKSEIMIISLFAMIWWILFLFVDVISQNNDTISKQAHFVSDRNTTNIYQDFHETITKQEQAQLQETAEVDIFGVQEESLNVQTQTEIKEQLNIDQETISDIKIQDIKTDSRASILEDIQVLEKLYKQSPNPLIVKVLIEKLSQDYQFDKAKEYADNLISISWLQSIDLHMYIQVAFNSSDVSVMKSSSIENIKPIVEEARVRGLISTDDYRFYQSLFLLWDYDYAWAQTLLKQIDTPRYSDFIAQMNYISDKVKQEKDMPAYYQEALISLNLLKNWYFSIAKKLAIDVLKQDDKYILPYQILAYSHFLTNNWDSAVDYLFKLTDFDPQNKSLYTFLIGVSYYWMDKNEQSIIYLSQIEKTVLENNKDGFNPKDLLADSYRYLLLDYFTMNDQERIVSTWKKLLWQRNLSKSDFYTFFYENLFRPYIEWRDYKLYNMDPMLSEDYVEKCNDALIKSEEDVCIYGHAWLLFLLHDYDQAKSKLLYIAKNYPQSYIFHTLGDYYYQVGDLGKAKQYYIKATSMPHGDYEETILKEKLTEFATQF